jgi:hypothetical protein
MALLKALEEQILLLVKMYETRTNERQTQSKESQLRSCLYTRSVSTLLFTELKANGAHCETWSGDGFTLRFTRIVNNVTMAVCLLHFVATQQYSWLDQSETHKWRVTSGEAR